MKKTLGVVLFLVGMSLIIYFNVFNKPDSFGTGLVLNILCFMPLGFGWHLARGNPIGAEKKKEDKPEKYAALKEVAEEKVVENERKKENPEDYMPK